MRGCNAKSCQCDSKIQLESEFLSVALQLKDHTMAEPITALITLPFAFVGLMFWEISWLSYPLVAFLFRRRQQKPYREKLKDQDAL